MKKTYQLNVRLDKESHDKLNDFKRKSGKTKRTIIRDLIEKGTVNVYYGQKDVMKRISKVENTFNQNTLAVRRDLQNLEKKVNELKVACSSNDQMLVKPLAVNIESFVENLNDKYLSNRELAEKEMHGYVNI